jgi:hypothetical protein
MSNPKKHDSGASEGARRATEDAPVRAGADDFQAEIKFLGIQPSPAFVRQPEGNGCIERFFRTLLEVAA